jgi:hypothetical protein
MLHNKYIGGRQVSESDFSTAERTDLNRVAISCASDSASHSAPQLPVPSLHSTSLGPLPSVLTHRDDIHVLRPTRTYRMTLVTSAGTHSYPCRQSFHFLSNVCSPTITDRFWLYYSIQYYIHKHKYTSDS